MAVVFGILIVSFAIWGIGDIFRGAARTTVATVGKTEISAETFRAAYQNELQRSSVSCGQSITPDQARALGIDRQVLQPARDRGRARPAGARARPRGVRRKLVARRSPRSRPSAAATASSTAPVRETSCARTASPRRCSCASSAARWCACRSRRRSPAPCRCRSRCARRCTATAPSGARPPIWCCRPRPRATSRLRPTSSSRRSSRSARRRSARRSTGPSTSLAIDPQVLARPDEVTEADARQRYDAVKAIRYGTPERRDPATDRVPVRRGGRGGRAAHPRRHGLRGDRGRAQPRSEGPRARDVRRGPS